MSNIHEKEGQESNLRLKSLMNPFLEKWLSKNCKLQVPHSPQEGAVVSTDLQRPSRGRVYVYKSLFPRLFSLKPLF